MSQVLFQQLAEELAAIAGRLTCDAAQLTRLARSHPVCQRLMTMPGLGELTATALVAAVSDAAPFKNRRQFAAWLGLVPRQQSPGGKSRLLEISQRGDRYLRPPVVHGARSGPRWVERQHDRRSPWARSLLERRGWNRAAVALAHKNACVAGVLLRTDRVYWAANLSGARCATAPQVGVMPRGSSVQCKAMKVMRRQGRPACPDPDGVWGLRGRYINQAGKAQMSSGLEGRWCLPEEAAYTRASVSDPQ
jgi:transposase IS116/IS110/IS902 family protein